MNSMLIFILLISPEGLPETFSPRDTLTASHLNTLISWIGQLEAEISTLRDRIEILERVISGSSQEHPASSCLSAKNAGMARSGLVWIQLGDDGPIHQLYCDQEFDGGGWILVSNSVSGANSIEFWREENPYLVRGSASLNSDYHNGCATIYGYNGCNGDFFGDSDVFDVDYRSRNNNFQGMEFIDIAEDLRGNFHILTRGVATTISKVQDEYSNIFHFVFSHSGHDHALCNEDLPASACRAHFANVAWISNEDVCRTYHHMTDLGNYGENDEYGTYHEGPGNYYYWGCFPGSDGAKNGPSVRIDILNGGEATLQFLRVKRISRFMREY